MTLLKFVLTHALGSQTEPPLMGEVEPIMQSGADCQQILGEYLLRVLPAGPPPPHTQHAALSSSSSTAAAISTAPPVRRSVVYERCTQIRYSPTGNFYSTPEGNGFECTGVYLTSMFTSRISRNGCLTSFYA